VLNGIATNEAAKPHQGEAKSTLSAEKGTEECREEEHEKGAKSFGEKSNRARVRSKTRIDRQEESSAETR